MNLTILYTIARDIPYEETKGAIVKKSTEEATLTLEFDNRDNVNYFGNRILMVIDHDHKQCFNLHESKVTNITRTSEGKYIAEIDLDIYDLYKYSSYKKTVTTVDNTDVTADFKNAKYIFGFNRPEYRYESYKYHEFNINNGGIVQTLAEYEANGNRSFLVESIRDFRGGGELFKRLFQYPSGRSAMESQNRLGWELVVGNLVTIDLKGMTYISIF